MKLDSIWRVARSMSTARGVCGREVRRMARGRKGMMVQKIQSQLLCEKVSRLCSSASRREIAAVKTLSCA